MKKILLAILLPASLIAGTVQRGTISGGSGGTSSTNTTTVAAGANITVTTNVTPTTVTYTIASTGSGGSGIPTMTGSGTNTTLYYPTTIGLLETSGMTNNGDLFLNGAFSTLIFGSLIGNSSGITLVSGSKALEIFDTYTGNVQDIENQSINGFSATYYTDNNGYEHAAWGWGNTNSGGLTQGVEYHESSYISNNVFFVPAPDYLEIQTGPILGGPNTQHGRLVQDSDGTTKIEMATNVLTSVAAPGNSNLLITFSATIPTITGGGIAGTSGYMQLASGGSSGPVVGAVITNAGVNIPDGGSSYVVNQGGQISDSNGGTLSILNGTWTHGLSSIQVANADLLYNGNVIQVWASDAYNDLSGSASLNPNTHTLVGAWTLNGALPLTNGFPGIFTNQMTTTATFGGGINNTNGAITNGTQWVIFQTPSCSLHITNTLFGSSYSLGTNSTFKIYSQFGAPTNQFSIEVTNNQMTMNLVGGGNTNTLTMGTNGNVSANGVILTNGFGITMSGSANTIAGSGTLSLVNKAVGGGGIFINGSQVALMPVTQFQGNNASQMGAAYAQTANVGTLQVTNGIVLPYVFTNFVVNTQYSNPSSTSPVEIMGVSAGFTDAAVAGFSAVAIYTNGVAMLGSTNQMLTAIGGVTGSQFSSMVNFLVVPSGNFFFTNISSGAGNAATVSGGQLVFQ